MRNKTTRAPETPPAYHLRLRYLRIALKLTQTELAKILEIPQSSLSRIETGAADLSVRHLLSIRTHLGIPIDAFLDVDWPAELLVRKASEHLGRPD